MRRLPILLVFVLIFALLALVPASAKPDCVIDPNHPSCPADDPDDPTPEPIGGGTVCDPADYPFYVPDGEDDELVQIDGVQYDNFTFQLSGKQAITCIDVISEEGPWEVTITGSGARNVGVIPRDSIASGDSCGGYLLRKQQIYTTVTLSAYGGDMPAATINACGTDDPEWVDTALWDVDPLLVAASGVCAVVEGDQCLVATRQPDVEHPLVLQAFLSGSADGATTFYVDLPPLDDDWPDLPPPDSDWPVVP